MTHSKKNTETNTLTVFNPFDLSQVDELAEHDTGDVEMALATAHALFNNRDTWLPAHQRIAVLERSASLMEKRIEQLAQTAVREGGKPITDTRVEVAEAIETIKSVIATLRSDCGSAIPMGLTPGTGKRMAFTRREPVGVSVAVSAFNNPLHLIVHQVAPAIAAGCPIIIKPAPDTPLSCLTFVEILREAGLPEGWAHVIVTSNKELTEKLATDPRVAFLTFAGSPNVGWPLRSMLAPGTRCSLEHGGAAPVIITGDSDIYEVREAILKGCFYHAGQDPVSVQRIFTHTKIATRFATQLAMKAAGLKLGDPMDPETEVGPLIRPAEVNRIHEWVSEAVRGGGQLLTGGNKLSETVYAPTVIFNPPKECRLMREEAFGPVVCVDPWFDIKDAIKRANALPTALHAAVFTRDVEQAMLIIDRLDASAVIVNDHTGFHPGWIPFSGLRQSGLGTKGAPYMLQNMSVEKMVVLRTDPLVTPSDIEPE